MKLYMHAGSLNHGCEAIIRSTVGMAEENVILYSEYPEEDLKVNLDEICEIKNQGGSRSQRNPAFIICKIVELITKNPMLKHWYAYKNVIKSASPKDLYLSIGGDNYCYNANPYLMYINKALTKRGARTGLWGCSIEPDLLKNQALIKDMKRYSFISARETITYDALKSAGLTNVHFYPDPAFTLQTKKCELPEQFQSGRVVGINLSPLVQKLNKTGTLVMDNYIELIKYILNETDMSIALIPHVCKSGNDDREAMKALASLFPNEKRIVMVNEEGTMDCRKLKYIISKCKFIITARTHASIAAYSTCVPTLVLGYSVKAKGIARDIFGDDKGYVVDLRNLNDKTELLSKFIGIQAREIEIRNLLQERIPVYISKAREAKTLLQKHL